MRPYFGIGILCLLMSSPALIAQTQIPYCGLTNEITEVDLYSSNPCFDVDEIIEKCIPVYVKINLHFFVETNGQGSVQQMEKSQQEIYKIAEQMIDEANHAFKVNEAQWQVENPIVPCVPIRLVLKGIYTHCKSNAVGIFNTLNLNDEFGVNKDTEINFYIAASDQSGASGIGYHNGRCGSATFFNRESWWTIGNFVHELGHIFTLRHSFENGEACDDTPKINYDWDKNCNGILEDSHNSFLNERRLTCWNKLEPGKKVGEEGFSDINKNNVHDCDEQSPCTECPCCRMENIDNNVMSYSAVKSAITLCQLRQMLNDISGFNCGIIEKIGGCPPTNAFITLTQEDQKDQTNCSECLILEASVNEEQYELKIYEQQNGMELLEYDSGLKFSRAINFCYKTSEAFLGLPNYLKPNTNYIAYLRTMNSCSESKYKYPFKTNPIPCGNVTFETLDIQPNPGSENLIIHLNAIQYNDILKGYAKNILNGNIFTLTDNLKSDMGNNQISLDISFLPSGSYSIIFLGNQSLYRNNFIKL